MGKISFKNINKIYANGFQAVHNFDLEVGDGEFVVFVGPSGCGKSTVLRMIAGLEEISGGEMLLDGKVINKCPPVERDIAVVFQDYALYGNMTVYDNVGMSLRVRHEKDTVIYDKVKAASGILGLDSLLKRLPGQLSGGQKQRVALGRSVVRQPKVFLMDEPLSNLDAKLRTSTRGEIVKLQRDLAVTTIYVTHDQTEAMTMADRMVVLKDGIIQQVGTPREIYYEPCNMFVAGFIGAPQMNFIEGRLDGNEFVFGNQRLWLAPETVKGLDGYKDRKLVLGIRPEQFEIAESQDAVSPPHIRSAESKVSPPHIRSAESEVSADTVTGELENKEFLGNYHILYVRVGEDILLCRIEGLEDKFKRQITLRFGREHLYFFDPETTRLVLYATESKVSSPDIRSAESKAGEKYE